ncbi:hypothetical protein NF681_21150 (plasmid) [Comamonadaceae bacterium OTU4NAUVB1]|nr:hypothetical protein NF681_21150 [Comamonadaceae bacterium OTU4NAUVB1]
MAEDAVSADIILKDLKLNCFKLHVLERYVSVPEFDPPFASQLPRMGSFAAQAFAAGLRHRAAPEAFAPPGA